jgi:hypothetical protein
MNAPAPRPLADIYRDPSRPYRMHRWDHYIPIYERHFSRFRDRPVNVLEIGVQEGGGLWMWHKYFHPDSAIFGVDINPACARPDLTNVEVEIGDQADPDFWLYIRSIMLGPFDIVIDDGGHTMNQQITAFESIYHTMAPDGVYLVEDTHTSLWGGRFWDNPPVLPKPWTFMDKAHLDTERLMDWSGREENFHTLMGPARGTLDGRVSEFCRTTQSIHFYDSIVVYERGPRTAPGHALR